jgi:hypothetical protein
MKITKRVVVFFILGFITLVMIETIMDWQDNEKAFNDGRNSFFEIESDK